MKEKNLQSGILYPATLVQIWQRNQKLSRQAKVKRIQQYQTSFTTDAKQTSLGRKLKTRKRPTKNKPKTTKKMLIGSNISIITLTVNELSAPTKRHRLAGQMKTYTYIHLHLARHSAWPNPCQIVCNYLYC